MYINQRKMGSLSFLSPHVLLPESSSLGLAYAVARETECSFTSIELLDLTGDARGFFSPHSYTEQFIFTGTGFPFLGLR